MALIVTPKTKRQERILKEFPENHSINFQSEAEEDAALLNVCKKGERCCRTCEKY